VSARALHEHGAQIALTYQGERVQDEVEKLAQELGARSYPCDVASDASLTEMAEAVRRDYGRLDTMVHSI
jgi:enoyl-[acyl-carrier protein] reductase I